MTTVDGRNPGYLGFEFGEFSGWKKGRREQLEAEWRKWSNRRKCSWQNFGGLPESEEESEVKPAVAVGEKEGAEEVTEF